MIKLKTTVEDFKLGTIIKCYNILLNVIALNDTVVIKITKFLQTFNASSVYGSSQGKGPTFDCHTKVKGLQFCSSCITKCTVAPISEGYESPRLTA